MQRRNLLILQVGGHRCSNALGTSASSPFVRPLPLRSAATSLLRRGLIIGASQVNVKSLPVSTSQVALHSGLLPSVFGCTGHVCKLAIRPAVAASISSNIMYAACFDHLCVASQVAPVSTPQVALHSGLLPSVFGCTGHVCKLAIRPAVAASISSNIMYAACFDHLSIGASQVELFLFQHRKSFFIPDSCHRCSDARGV